ncbi:MAG: competence/damage-inducible protein A [Deltaproteobacteria bacterium]|nr:competence/damage-inducible protein A [Deltaproteobacteria bacterium]
MQGQILTIGTELTRGELADTNGAWLAAEMLACGIEVTGLGTVDDDEGRIVEAILRTAGLAEVVVVTGGLGPTTDDLTAACAARAAGVGMWKDAASIEAIRDRFRLVGLEMTPNNEKQAIFPGGAEVLPNPVGTAPGFAMAIGRARFFFLPGVPFEMKRLFLDHVAPWLRSRRTGGMVQKVLRCFGTGESNIGAKLEGVEAAFPGVTIGYRATFPEIEVKVLARAGTPEEAEALCRAATAEARSRLGDLVFADRPARLAEVVGERLRKAGKRLAIAESCTGGLIAHLVTQVPGSSDYFLLGAVTYSNESKERILGVRHETLEAHGAVSAETAAEMATGCLALCDADLAVSVTGIAGPGGGSADKPVGLIFLALADRSGKIVHHQRTLRGDRFRIQMLAAYVALRMVLIACGGEGLR